MGRMQGMEVGFLIIQANSSISPLSWLQIPSSVNARLTVSPLTGSSVYSICMIKNVFSLSWLQIPSSFNSKQLLQSGALEGMTVEYRRVRSNTLLFPIVSAHSGVQMGETQHSITFCT